MTLSYLGPTASGQQPTATAAGLLDEILAGGAKSGYDFLYTATTYNAATNTYNGYTLNANPESYGQTGSTYYYQDQSFVIRANNTATAGSSDSAVGD